MSDNKHRINKLLDKLTLESLWLMEQHIRSKLALEKCMVDGESHLAKTRYIMGHKNVSQLQLPNADSTDFQAMTVLNHEDNKDLIKDSFFDLEFRDVNIKSEDKEGTMNPIKWFGVLVPQSLHFAQDRFKQSLYWSIKSVNIQKKLSDCLVTIRRLNKLSNV